MPIKQVFLEHENTVSEEQIDNLEQLLRTKIDLKTGYAEPHTLARTMHNALRALDLSDDGILTRQSFRSVMLKMNCGEDKEAVDALFHRHDLQGKGKLSMKTFSDQLFGIRRVAQSSAQCRDVIKVVRAKLLSRGENGYRGLVRTLRVMDDNGNRRLDKLEMGNGLQTYGLDLTRDEVSTIFHFFDKDGDGSVDVTEFMVALRPKISDSRLALVRLAFTRLDRNPDGKITMDELKSMYEVDRHPAVVKGTKTPDDVFQEFTASWNKNGDSEITAEEFEDYYKDISATIDNDAYFELMMRNAWRISGGKGQAANTANLRVCVTHLDGTQSIETIENDMGIDPDDKDQLLATLRKQGVADILKVAKSY